MVFLIKGGSRFIVIPGGTDGLEWRYFVDFIRGFLKSDKKISSQEVNRACGFMVPNRTQKLTQEAEVKKSLARSSVSRLIGDWKKFFVCEREKLCPNWQMIQEELSKLLECDILLMSFQINKVGFYCQNMDKAWYFLGKAFLKSGVAVNLCE